MELLKVFPLNSHSMSFRTVRAVPAGEDCAREILRMFPEGNVSARSRDTALTRMCMVPFSAGEAISQ